MFKNVRKTFTLLLTLALIFQMIGCGTILYPERRGQTGGRIDVGVAILDGLGLLLFVIPGIVAFAVDFGTGAIYLPGTSKASLDVQEITKVEFDPGRSSIVSIEKIIKQETGYDVQLDGADVEIYRYISTDDMLARLAEQSFGPQQVHPHIAQIITD